MSARPVRRTAALLVIALAAPACAAPEADTAAAEQAIIGGAQAEGDPAVVLLVSYPADHSTFDSCTASVIAADVLLTAAHCLDPVTHPDYAYGVFLGPDASAYPTANTLVPQLTPAKEVHVHPDYDPEAPFTADIGVVLLAAPLDIAPLPVGREPLDASVVGKEARIVGYGQTKYQEYNAIRYEATTVVAALDTGDTVTVGDPMHRSCIGDSGGPALQLVGGVETIIGVDSYTDLAGCLQPAHYRRPDLYTEFLDTFAPPVEPGGTGGEGGTGGMAGGAAGSGGGAADSGRGCSISASTGCSEGAWLAIALGFAAALGRKARRRGWLAPGRRGGIAPPYRRRGHPPDQRRPRSLAEAGAGSERLPCTGMAL